MLTGCPICDRGLPLNLIAEFPASWVTAGAEAPLPGYVCVVSKRHVAEPFELAAAERIEFWEDCLSAAAALKRLLKATKINYEIHGNTIPHLHMHIYPRHQGDAYDGRPIDGSARFPRNRRQLRRIAEVLRAAAASRTIAGVSGK